MDERLKIEVLDSKHPHMAIVGAELLEIGIKPYAACLAFTHDVAVATGTPEHHILYSLNPEYWGPESLGEFKEYLDEQIADVREVYRETLQQHGHQLFQLPPVNADAVATPEGEPRVLALLDLLAENPDLAVFYPSSSLKGIQCWADPSLAARRQAADDFASFEEEIAEEQDTALSELLDQRRVDLADQTGQEG